MKKGLLAFVLVLSLAPIANATVIDVVTDGLSDYGHNGTASDPLQAYGEAIEIKLVLNHNPYPDYPSYDGYLLSSMDTMLSVSGPGTLEQMVWAKVPYWDPVPDNEIWLQDAYLTPLRGPADILPAIDLRIVAVGPGFITLDLSINGLGEYAPYGDLADNPWPDPPGWVSLTGSDLGDLALHSNAIPEPVTILILGLGGLLLIRKH